MSGLSVYRQERNDSQLKFLLCRALLDISLIRWGFLTWQRLFSFERGPKKHCFAGGVWTGRRSRVLPFLFIYPFSDIATRSRFVLLTIRNFRDICDVSLPSGTNFLTFHRARPLTQGIDPI